MAYDGRIMQRALARFDEDKQRRSAQLDQRRRALYAREPRLAEIETELERRLLEREHMRPLHSNLTCHLVCRKNTGIYTGINPSSEKRQKINSQYTLLLFPSTIGKS